MMKFNWWHDKYPEPEKWDLCCPENKLHLKASAWPTVDELEDIISPMTADTIIQILRGDGIYRGWEVESHVDNKIINTKSQEGFIKGNKKHKEFDQKGWIKREPINPYRLIKWRKIPKVYQTCIRIIMRNKLCTRLQAQEQFLPQVMSIKQVMK